MPSASRHPAVLWPKSRLSPWTSTCNPTICSTAIPGLPYTSTRKTTCYKALMTSERAQLQVVQHTTPSHPSCLLGIGHQRLVLGHQRLVLCCFYLPVYAAALFFVWLDLPCRRLRLACLWTSWKQAYGTSTRRTISGQVTSMRRCMRWVSFLNGVCDALCEVGFNSTGV